MPTNGHDSSIPAQRRAGVIPVTSRWLPALTLAGALAVTIVSAGDIEAEDVAPAKPAANAEGDAPAQSAAPAASTSGKVRTVQTFTLVGIASYERGSLAFFEGTDARFRQMLRPGEKIGGLVLTKIDADQVTLEVDGKTFQLHLLTQMQREDAGAWRLLSSKASFTSSAPASNGQSNNARSPEPDRSSRLKSAAETIRGELLSRSPSGELSEKQLRKLEMLESAEMPSKKDIKRFKEEAEAEMRVMKKLDKPDRPPK